MMTKLTVSSLLLVVLAAASSQHTAHAAKVGTVHLRNTGYQQQQEQQPEHRPAKEFVKLLQLQQTSSCNNYHDKNSCYGGKDEDTGTACEWCIAGAIPSECMSQQQAKLLPAAVFECSTPTVTSTSTSSSSLFHETTTTTTTDEVLSLSHKTPTTMTTTFRFFDKDDDDVTHTLNVRNTDNLCDASSKSIAGYMDIEGSKYDEKGENKHLFFWMFEKRSTTTTREDAEVPFIVWLTGGPGCSSTLALLTENGPCSVDPKTGESTVFNPYSWTEAAHVLWLDQPAGVGFSYGQETDTNEEMISEDAYYFLQAFFQTYPEYQASPLYFVGESYGGHYAPAIAHRVMTGNKAIVAKTIPLKLAGLGIGNGLTAPQEQYKWYPVMGYNNSHHIQVFDENTYKNMMDTVVPSCIKLIEKCQSGDNVIDDFACQSAFVVCNAGLTSPYQMTGLNPYDMRKECGNNPLCYDFSHVAHFLNRPATKQALNVDAKHAHAWNACNYGINMKFHVDWMKDFSHYVAELLDIIPVLIYAGDVDFICNYLGNQAWTDKLEWKGSSAFAAAPRVDWLNGAGLMKSAGGFTFLQVYDAGHMVPSDQPEVALTMIRNFVTTGLP